jgi:hypothetical protein
MRQTQPIADCHRRFLHTSRWPGRLIVVTRLVATGTVMTVRSSSLTV